MISGVPVSYVEQVFPASFTSCRGPNLPDQTWGPTAGEVSPVNDANLRPTCRPVGGWQPGVVWRSQHTNLVSAPGAGLLRLGPLRYHFKQVSLKLPEFRSTNNCWSCSRFAHTSWTAPSGDLILMGGAADFESEYLYTTEVVGRGKSFNLARSGM